MKSSFQVVLVETASWKGEQGCKVKESYLFSIKLFNNLNISKVDRPGGHAEPEESLKLLAEAERKVMNDVTIEMMTTFASVYHHHEGDQVITAMIIMATTLYSIVTNATSSILEKAQVGNITKELVRRELFECIQKEVGG